jgi:hypothetical protein
LRRRDILCANDEHGPDQWLARIGPRIDDPPGFVGSNIEGVLRGQERKIVEEGHLVRKDLTHGNWDKLSASVAEIGSSAEEIFAVYHEVQKKVGKNEMKNIPFDVKQISRSDVFSCNRETEKETGIPFITDVEDDKAKKVLLAK